MISTTVDEVDEVEIRHLVVCRMAVVSTVWLRKDLPRNTRLSRRMSGGARSTHSGSLGQASGGWAASTRSQPAATRMGACQCRGRPGPAGWTAGFYCVYGWREGGPERGVYEAHGSSRCGRTWWSLDQLLAGAGSPSGGAAGARGCCLGGAAPPDFPKLPMETAPTEGQRRKPAAASLVASWLDGPGATSARSTRPRPMATTNDWGDEEEGGRGAFPDWKPSPFFRRFIYSS
jgi:hypothetical protein